MAQCAAASMRERDVGEFTLDEVAERAETTVQSVLRTYGSKDALFVEALSKFATADVDETMRDAVVPGDIPETIATLFRLYDKIGDAVIRMLADEPRFPALKDGVTSAMSAPCSTTRRPRTRSTCPGTPPTKGRWFS